MNIRSSFLMLLSTVSFLGITSVYGQDLTEREKEMLGLIERLEKRVEQLERSIQRTQPPAELDRRVQELEEKIESIEPAQDKDFRVYWKEGMRFDSQDGSVKLKFGGRIMNDRAFFSVDDDLTSEYGDFENGTEFRRARLYISGDIYEHFMFKAQYDFAGGDADFKDMYIGLKDIPYIGHLKVGHFKEPFGLEEMNSSKYIIFMERALTSPFTPVRNTGFMIYDDALDERLTWAAGVFRDTDDFGDGVEDGNFNITGRVTGLPWYRENGRKLLHLGLAYSFRSPDETRFRDRPEAHLSPVRLVDTGSFPVDNERRIGTELALVYGPFSFQSEYMRSDVDTDLVGNRDFDAFYAMASYFITGENRAYKRSAGAFDRVKPKRNFSLNGEDRGPGAWEVALRD
ncbi:MAG: hypothetical protein IIB42_04535, partial [Candidatus Marinimicrobia bacterium]|nr:hypothetical protein [Candidatus Neomarinimicrobiota bacterium]